jgi:hypothetical protein
MDHKIIDALHLQRFFLQRLRGQAFRDLECGGSTRFLSAGSTADPSDARSRRAATFKSGVKPPHSHTQRVDFRPAIGNRVLVKNRRM